MALKDPKMSKQGTAGKRKRVTLTIPQILEIIRSLEIGYSTICDVKKWKEQLWLFVASNGSMKDLFRH
jgi:hypothetical protein